LRITGTFDLISLETLATKTCRAAMKLHFKFI
jgi:hypothetical protein